MVIALDYDDTYTRDPDFWEKFATLAEARGHSVTILTKRGPSNQGNVMGSCRIPVIYTDRKAKKPFAEAKGFNFDIWIDDAPQNLFVDG